jgi:hypothetical protein
MHLFIVTRWGNPHELAGPDGKDTNFLVRAYSIKEASDLVDFRLRNMTSQVPGNRDVQTFAHSAVQIGEDSLSREVGIIHGPWIETSVIHDSPHYPSWCRDEIDEEWVDSKDYYGTETAE